MSATTSFCGREPRFHASFVYLGYTMVPVIVGRAVAAQGVDQWIKAGSDINLDPGLVVPCIDAARLEKTNDGTSDSPETRHQREVGIQVV